MSVIEGLKKTPKGQLMYDRYLLPSKLNNELDQYSSPPLSGPHKEREFSLMNLSFGLDLLDFSNDSCSNSYDNLNNLNDYLKYSQDDVNISNNDNNSNSQPSAHQMKSPSGQMTISEALSKLDIEINKESNCSEVSHQNGSPSSSTSNDDSDDKLDSTRPSPMFTQYGMTFCAILDEEKTWNYLTKQAMYKRRCQFDDHEAIVKFLMKQKKDDMETKITNLVSHRDNLIEQNQQESQAKVHKRLQKLKEGHEEHQKKIVTKHQEIERQREKLEEEEKNRLQLELAKLQQLQSLFKEFGENKNTFAKLCDSFELKEKVSEMIGKHLAAFDKIYNALAQQLAECDKTKSVPSDLVGKFVAHRDQSLHKVESLKRQMDVLRKDVKDQEGKDAELRKIEADRKEQEKQNAETALDYGIQSMAFVLKDKQAKEKILAAVTPVVQGFASNAQMKKYRFDLQRAVNTPINAISSVSGSHLRDKLQILQRLLGGQLVQVSGKQVSAGQSPEGMVFCQNLIAKMLVKKGEEQVTSNHESAFAIAGVAVGLWVEFPSLGDLILAHIQAVCPYVLPFYSVRQDGQSTQDYYRSMGYKIDEEGTVEAQDKFLHRMSGVMRLYCAFMVTAPPKGAHPYGVVQAWTWLCRTMNMEPQPDITATMIFDLLSVTGHFLFREYKIQFVKLLHVLYKMYLPKLKSVSITNSTVGRLEIFLETSLQANALVALPKGFLSSNFWLS